MGGYAVRQRNGRVGPSGRPKLSGAGRVGGVMRWALVVLAVLGSTPAGAVSLLVEGTGARQFTSLSLMGEFELVKDRTFLTTCVSSTRFAPVEVTAGTDASTVTIPRSNQLCLGLDHG